MNWLDSNSMLLTKKGLDVSWQRQKTIHENIANISTPGYKAKYVTFGEELRGQLQRLNRSGETGAKPYRQLINQAQLKISRSENESMRLDGNNVNADMEQIEMARAQLEYDYLTMELNSQYSRLRMAIEGR